MLILASLALHLPFLLGAAFFGCLASGFLLLPRFAAPLLLLQARFLACSSPLPSSPHKAELQKLSKPLVKLMIISIFLSSANSLVRQGRLVRFDPIAMLG